MQFLSFQAWNFPFIIDTRNEVLLEHESTQCTIFASFKHVLNICILLDVLVCSIAVYFNELCCILTARRASQNTNHE